MTKVERSTRPRDQRRPGCRSRGRKGSVTGTAPWPSTGRLPAGGPGTRGRSWWQGDEPALFAPQGRPSADTVSQRSLSVATSGSGRTAGYPNFEGRTTRDVDHSGNEVATSDGTTWGRSRPPAQQLHDGRFTHRQISP